VITGLARTERVLELRASAPDLDLDSVPDPGADSGAVSLGAERAAWGRVRDDATHHLVLRDDVVPCADLGARLRRAVTTAPAGALSLFADWGSLTAQAIRLAALEGAAWTLVADAEVPRVALVLPAAEARRFPAFAKPYRDVPGSPAMTEFLSRRGVPVHVSIPNLVDLGPAPQPTLEDLLHGRSRATVLPVPGRRADGLAGVVAPPAVAGLGVGDLDAFCHYMPLRAGSVSSPSMGHEVLVTHGPSMEELTEEFASDLDYHPEAADLGLGDSLLFQFWIAMFMQGVIARGDTVGDTVGAVFDARLADFPVARAALATFACGALRGTIPPESFSDLSEQMTPFCVRSMRSGFIAPGHWPGLRILCHPDEYDIRPRWNVGARSDEQD